MASVIQPSFSSGELSPTLHGRVDLAKYKVGTALMRNFFVDYRGGASNRTGTRFVGRARRSDGEVRLIRFAFNTEQTYVLEFGHGYMRVIKDGELVLEANKTITGASNDTTAAITSAGHGFVTGDTVFIRAIVGTTQLNQKFFLVGATTTNTFELKTLSGVPVNSSAYGAYVSGGTVARVYTLATPYNQADLALLKFTQSADVMTLTHPDYSAYDLTRTDHDEWTLEEVEFIVDIQPPTTITGVASPSGTSQYYYVVTSISALNGEESVASAAVKVASVNISATAGTNLIEWAPVNNAAYYNVYRAYTGTSSIPPVGAAYGYCGTTQGLNFHDTNTTPDFTKCPPVHRNPFAKGAITKINVVTAGTGYTSATCTITDSTGPGFGAVATPIVDSGIIKGFLIVNGGQDYGTPVVTIGGAGSGATATAELGPINGVFPSTVTYHQQRKVYAASRVAPSTLWGSKPGAFKNMDTSIPVNADDSYTFTLASQELNAIKYMLSMPGGLVVLTGSGAWQMSGSGQQNSPLTAIDAMAQPQAYNGCGDVPPIAINYELLYVQSRGSTIRNLSYNVFANIYTGTDMCILSNHFFTGYSIKEWTYAEEPFKLIWCVRDDGKLLSFTFLKEQEVYGWALHTTKGLYKSVTSIQEGAEDVVYFVVRRKIDGEWVNYIERQASRNLAAGVEESWFVDCGLDYPLTYPAATLAPASATGASVIFTASASVFTAGNVGDDIRVGGGIARVTGYTSGTVVTCRITQPITAVIPEDSDATPLEALEGDWSISTPTTVVSGLEHLEGQTVAILGDGNEFPQATVVDGAVTLNRAVSRIIVGLPYTSKLQSLYLDVGDPTIQGKRKRIHACTVRMAETRGIKIGESFDRLTEFKERTSSVPMGRPIPLHTGDQRALIDASWNEGGQICIQQDKPLPCSILAIIPEVNVGDSSR